jgi:hypothetical protein
VLLLRKVSSTVPVLQSPRQLCQEAYEDNFISFLLCQKATRRIIRHLQNSQSIKHRMALELLALASRRTAQTLFSQKITSLTHKCLEVGSQILVSCSFRIVCTRCGWNLPVCEMSDSGKSSRSKPGLRRAGRWFFARDHTPKKLKRARIFAWQNFVLISHVSYGNLRHHSDF